jgi:glycosyltransferase involved in cell wall biosynthesis
VDGEQINYISESKTILCLGVGWFPKTPGGLERYVYELTQRLAANNKDKVELCGVGLPESTTDSSIKLTNLAEPDSRIWQRLLTIRKQFQKTRVEKPDAINLHFALYSLPILDILPKNVPITFNFHGPWALESQSEGINSFTAYLKKTFIEKNVYNRCQRFIVLSKAFGKILHEEYQVPWEKIQIIPGGVDINWFKPTITKQEARSKLNWSLERPTLFTSRRLVNRVGLDKLLTAIAKIKPRIPDIMLAIAGRGPLEATLKQQATELGLDNHVKFLGFLPDELLPVAYQAADFSVMPTQSFEGFGLAVVESLACGTPVICTPVGGMPEILEPFSPDLLTSSTTATTIAEKLEQAFLRQITVPSSDECRQYATQNYDWDKIAQQVRQVLLGE